MLRTDFREKRGRWVYEGSGLVWYRKKSVACTGALAHVNGISEGLSAYDM